MTSSIHSQHSRRKEFLSGMAATLPLVIGAIPFGIIFGALASTAGFSGGGTQAMSLFVFAGSAQFIAAGLIANGSSLLVIIITTLVVNLRHMLYGATLAPHLKSLPQRWLLPLGFWLTDESFVVVIERFRKADQSTNKHWFFLGSAVFMYTNWQLCTFIGVLAGQRIDDPLKWGLDFAMIVTFIGMLIPMIRDKTIAVAVISAGAAALLLRGLPNQLGLILAALIGVAAGLLANDLIKKQKEGTSVS
ncbi:MAG: AzlC family ABC transporter permease [Chloroflexota bacterium]